MLLNAFNKTYAQKNQRQQATMLSLPQMEWMKRQYHLRNPIVIQQKIAYI